MENLSALQGAALLTLIELVGDSGAKIGNPLMTYGGYNALGYTLTQLLKSNGLIVTNSLWDGLSNIMTTTLGLFFGEVPTAREWVGVVLISVGIFILGPSSGSVGNNAKV